MENREAKKKEQREIKKKRETRNEKRIKDHRMPQQWVNALYSKKSHPKVTVLHLIDFIFNP
ncbi:hypothetical protein VIS19158_02205 [Vibrio scophthalmi LMG 19158]|uniref:Uncharacterized protein n=1 Tax=Vibrio scophthalmi LMG 19158 TaxID=870967 RepID=F9RI44_9VIBR|nr:hypothetical protein VIS19158_02205 [Vibrio scophthalmi LMG 19158]